MYFKVGILKIQQLDYIRRIFKVISNFAAFLCLMSFISFDCNTIRDAILTCAQKLTQVSLIYRTETNN